MNDIATAKFLLEELRQIEDFDTQILVEPQEE